MEKQPFPFWVGVLFLISAMLCDAQVPLLHYDFNEGSGVEAHGTGAHAATLEIGTAMGWTAKGRGVDGGTAIGRVGDGDAVLKSATVTKAMPLLCSYTVTGWVKLHSNEPFRATLFSVSASGGGRFQLDLVARRGKKPEPAWLCSFVARGGAGESAVGLWSPWFNPFTRKEVSSEEWIFFSAVIDPKNSSSRVVAFYMGTKIQPVVTLGAFRLGEHLDPQIYQLKNITEVGMGNITGEKGGFPVGMYLDDVCLFGSPEKNAGALTLAEIENIRLKAVEKDQPSK